MYKGPKERVYRVKLHLLTKLLHPQIGLWARHSFEVNNPARISTVQREGLNFEVFLSIEFDFVNASV